jgi:hypothetical protein
MKEAPVPTLSETEADMIDIVRKLTENASPPMVDGSGAFHVDVLRARAQAYRISYDRAGRALGGLVDKGLLERPRRGYYRLTTGSLEQAARRSRERAGVASPKGLGEEKR